MTELAAVSLVAVLSTVSFCFALLRFIRQEREAAAVERANLVQRIQSPEHAIVAHYNEQQTFDSPPAVNPELDEDHWASKEDLAELAAHEELSRG